MTLSLFLDLTHEGKEGLAGGDLPLLPVVPDDRLNALSVAGVGLVLGPVPVELRDLAPAVRRQHVRLK